MTIKTRNNKGKKIKCEYCRELSFFTEDNVFIDENESRYIFCEYCSCKIKLKRV